MSCPVVPCRAISVFLGVYVFVCVSMFVCLCIWLCRITSLGQLGFVLVIWLYCVPRRPVPCFAECCLYGISDCRSDRREIISRYQQRNHESSTNPSIRHCCCCCCCREFWRLLKPNASQRYLKSTAAVDWRTTAAPRAGSWRFEGTWGAEWSGPTDSPTGISTSVCRSYSTLTSSSSDARQTIHVRAHGAGRCRLRRCWRLLPIAAAADLFRLRRYCPTDLKAQSYLPTIKQVACYSTSNFSNNQCTIRQYKVNMTVTKIASYI